LQCSNSNSFNSRLSNFDNQIQNFVKDFTSLIKLFDSDIQPQTLFENLTTITQLVKEREETFITKFKQQFDEIVSFSKIQPDIQEMDQKCKIFFQQNEPLPSNLKSITSHILLYLNQFDQRKKEKFNYLHLLFGTGMKPEFPLSPYAFVIFVDSLSEKIIQLHEQSKRYETEIKQLNQIVEKERIIHSNSLIVLNRQCERRILLMKQYSSKND
jgi:hypothetical protein